MFQGIVGCAKSFGMHIRNSKIRLECMPNLSSGKLLKLAGNKKPSRLFRAWKENWEEAVLKKQDPVFAARLARKYGGIKWRDPDNGDQVVQSPLKKMHWIGARGAKGYYVIGAKDGYDMNKDVDEQDEDLWDYWETNEEFYGQVVEYYTKQNPDPSIDVHEKDGAADSESEEDE